ncbi:MAG: toprim domain-containing protein, partial [Thermus sp.]
AVRGVPLEALPATPLLRLHRGLIYREGEEVLGAFPALLARVEHPHHGLVALHRTYLAPDGTGKAPVPNPKKLTPPVFEGATRGAGIRLFPLEGEEVAVAEGIETALAVAVATGLPAYAAVSAGGLEAWIPPAGVRAVLIAADGDDTGKGAALALAKRLLAVGVKVRLAVPQEEGKDWADLVKAMEAVVAASQEVEHAQEEA